MSTHLQFEFRRDALCIAMAMLFSGCGDSELVTYPVTGRVQFADGSPMPGGAIEFETVGGETSDSGPARVNARGRIERDGTFTVITPPNHDGAVPGTHRVIVRALSTAYEPDVGERKPARPAVIDPRFEKYETSGLQVTVEPKPNEVTLEVKRP